MARSYAYNPYRIAPAYFQGKPPALVNASSNQGGNPNTTGPGSDFSQGTDFSAVESPGGNEVAVPNFVDFNPADYFISLDQAIRAGRNEGEFNLDLFNRNFNRSKQYALDTQQTELQGLESFIPRTSNLIRRADTQGNEDILRYSDVFDARNERAMRRATQGNVALRADIAEAAFPGTFDAIRGARARAEGDVSRVRQRESTSFVDDVLREQAARSARGRGADVASATGFGADSSAGMQLIDTFDVDRRLQIEQAKREDFRRGDAAIYGAENQVANAIIQSQNLFNTVIAPGIRDFTPIQPIPRVTDIGGQIRVMPSVDAGTLQRGFTEAQNAVSMLSPSQVFSGSLSTQAYNSGVGLQALGFEQEKNNVIAGAVNTGLNQDKADSVFQQQLDSFQNGLDARNQSQGIQAGTSLITTGLGVLGQLLTSYNSTPDSSPSKPQQQQSIGGAILSGIQTYGSQFYNGASDLINNLTGLDIGHFGVSAPPTGGVATGGGGGGVDYSQDGDIFSNTGAGFDVGGAGDFGGQSAADHAAATHNIDVGMAGYQNNLGSNDFYPRLTDQDYGLGSAGFDADVTGEGFQPTSYELDPGDTFEYTGNLDSGSENEFLRTARITNTSSGVSIVPKTEIINSFNDPSLRPSVMQKTAPKGLPVATMLQAYSLYDNWDNLSPINRAGASASLLNNLASHMGVVNGTIPGAAIGVMQSGANLFSNWDKLTPAQKAQAGIQTVGSLGAMGAALSGVGGPVGAAIIFGASALSNAAGVLAGQGIHDLNSFTTVGAPIQAQAANSINSILGNRFNTQDVNHAALFAEPTGIGSFIAAADMMFGLDLDFTSGKSKTQQFRDSLRSHLQKINFIGKDYTKRLFDGSVFDFGKDGGARLKNIGKNIDGKTDRQYSDVDFSNPNAPQLAAWGDVLGVLGFRSPQGRKFTGYFVNAATNQDPENLDMAKSNMKGMAADMGLDYGKSIKILDALKGELKQGEYEAFRNSLMTLYLK